MQKLGLVIIASAFLISCGGGAKDEKSNITEMKVKLVELKKEKSTLDAEIRKLEEDIAKADPSAAAKPKLVNVTAIDTGSFDHYIDLQGKIDAENIAYVSPR